VILFDRVTKAYQVGSTSRIVLQDVSLELPSHERLGVLGGSKSGKSTLIRLLAGLEDPSSGRILRYADLSFPIGYSRALRPHMSGRENVQHAARLYGADPVEVFEYVAAATAFGPMLDEPTRRYPQGDRTVLAAAIGYALPFNTYLIDESIASGTPEFRNRCFKMLETRCQDSGLILATQHPRKVRQYCNQVAVITEKRLELFENIQKGIDFFERLEMFEEA
jgi:capsular polysaccharide transport system ATP-binding protein